MTVCRFETTILFSLGYGGIDSMSDVHLHGSLTRKALFAPVIPTGAPQEVAPSGDSHARSGGIPRECPAPCCFREFSPACQSQQSEAEERIHRTASLQVRFLLGTYLTAVPRMTGTMHGKNSLGRHGWRRPVGISPLRARDSCGERLRRGAPVEMTA
jgi:hypothetical protein